MHMNLCSMVVVGSLSLGLAACQTAVSFPGARIDENNQSAPSVSGVISKPEGIGPFPAVVILHACGGVSQHINAGWPGYLNGIGYVALAVDTFGSRGYGRCPNPLWGHAALFVSDAYGALDYLAAQPFVDPARMAVIGFSVGANHINNALIHWRARKSGEQDFKAAIAFYGQCRGIGSYPEGSIPLMEVIAEHDNYSLGCMSNVGPRVEVHVIRGAYHAFDSPEYSGITDPAGNRMQYSAAATKEARELTKAFLLKHLGSRQ